MSSSHIQKFSPADHPSPPFYSHISLTPPNTTIIHLAGQIGRSPSLKPGEQLPSSLGSQVKIALENVDRCLAACGAKHADIISVKQYVVNLDPREQERRQLYDAWMSQEGPLEHKPPSTVIGVQGLALEGLLYEIEVVAGVKTVNSAQ